MNYNFPIIKTIEDVLPAVEGRSEFVVAERDGFTVINYNVGYSDTFDIDEDDLMANYGRAIPKGVMRRECRGLIFYPDGRIMSRPFHKFFNVGEREETQLRNIDLSKPHSIMEKLDGSMIRPLDIDGKVRLGTKMGVTDTSIAAEKIVTRNQLDWMYMMLKQGLTPLLEFVSPENRIVVRYDFAELVLLAVRNNETGDYMDIEEFRNDRLLFAIAPNYGSVEENLDEYIERQRGRDGREGDIIAIGNMRYKIKNDWYVRIHKVKDRIRTDRHILALLLEGELDDAYPHLDEEDYNYVKAYEAKFHLVYNQKLVHLTAVAKEALNKSDGDKKKLATQILPAMKNISKQDFSFIFSVADGRDLNQMILSHVTKNMGNTTKYEELEKWLGLT
jgi:RNA ligase